MRTERKTVRGKGARTAVRVLVLVGLLGAGLAAAWSVFGTDLVRDRLATRLQEVFERPVALEGLGVSVGSNLVLSARALSVTEGEAPRSPVFLAAEEAELSMGTWALLTGTLDAATLRMARLAVGGATCRDVRAKGRRTRDGRTVLEDFRAEAYGGNLSGKIEVESPTEGGLPVRATLRGDRLDAGRVAEEGLKWALPIRGRMDVALSLSGFLDPTGVETEGRVVMRDGEISNWPLLATLTSKLPFAGVMDLQQIPVEDLRATFRLAKEKTTFLEEMRANVAGVACRMRGSTGPEDLDLVLDVDLPVPSLKMEGLGLQRALAALFGAEVIPLRVRITGARQDPSIAVTRRKG